MALFLRFRSMLTLQAFLYVLYFFRIFPCRLFRWSFAIYGHPGLLSRQIRYNQIVPRFCPFESVHKQAEKFALNIEYHEFDKLHSIQPHVQQDDTRQPQTDGQAGSPIYPWVLAPPTHHTESIPSDLLILALFVCQFLHISDTRHLGVARIFVGSCTHFACTKHNTVIQFVAMRHAQLLYYPGTHLVSGVWIPASWTTYS